MNFSYINRKIILISLLVIIIGSVSLYIIIRYNRRKRNARTFKAASGTYLVAGGESYITIEKDESGQPVIGEGKILDSYWYSEYPVTSSRIVMKDEKLHIRQKIFIYNRFWGNDNNHINIYLTPSKTVPGDWDLVDAGFMFFGDYRLRNLFSANIKDFIANVNYIKLFFRNLASIFSEEMGFEWHLPPDLNPLQSYLHKINHSDAPFVLRNLARGDYSKETLKAARKIAGDLPEDPWIGLMLVEMEARRGNIQKAERLFEKWSKNSQVKSNLLLDKTAKRVQKTLHTNKWNQKCGRPFKDTFEMEKFDLNRLGHSCLFDGEAHIYYFKHFPFMFPFQTKEPYLLSRDFRNTMMYADLFATVILTESEFNLFLGNREKSLDLLKRVYSFGASLAAGETELSQTWGQQVCRTALLGLTRQTLNACENDAEREEMWELLENLNKMSSDNSIFEIKGATFGILINEDLNGLICPLFSGYELLEEKLNVTNMMLQNLRVAAAARSIHFETGRFPRTEKDFKDYFPDGLPEDVYNKPHPLKFFIRNDGVFTVYSLGPDKNDDGALVQYDIDALKAYDGDVVLDVPPEREFPFPENGVRADNSEQLLEQFPNGLPLDPFWRSGIRDSYKILESDESHPGMIFSYGPDMDQSQDFKTFENSDEPFRKEYQPENGNPEPQWIYFRKEEDAKNPEKKSLEPHYDPTNGIKSNGDIFIEIPRRSSEGSKKEK